MARVIFIKLHENKGFVHDLRKIVLKLDQRGMIELLIDRCKKLGLPEYIDLAKRLSGEEYALYKVILETNRVDSKLDNLFDRLQSLSLTQMHEMAESIEKKLINELLIGKGSDLISIIVDYPIEPGNTKMGKDVEVKIADFNYKNLHDVSGITNGVNKSFEDQLSHFRVLIHPQIKPDKEEKEKFEQAAIKATTEYLQRL